MVAPEEVYQSDAAEGTPPLVHLLGQFDLQDEVDALAENGITKERDLAYVDEKVMTQMNLSPGTKVKLSQLAQSWRVSKSQDLAAKSQDTAVHEPPAQDAAMMQFEECLVSPELKQEEDEKEEEEIAQDAEAAEEDEEAIQDEEAISPGYEMEDSAMCGCGILFEIDDCGSLLISSLVEEGSADECCLLAVGDVLTSIDMQDVQQMDISCVAPLLLGQAGSKVALGFKRLGEKVVVLERRPCIMMVDDGEPEEDEGLLPDELLVQNVQPVEDAVAQDEPVETTVEEVVEAAVEEVVQEAEEVEKEFVTIAEDSEAVEDMSGTVTSLTAHVTAEQQDPEVVQVVTPSKRASSPKKRMRGAKAKAALSASKATPANPNATLQDLKDLQEFERATSTVSASSFSHQVNDMAWLTFVLFIALLFSSSKLVGLSPEAANTMVQLVALWIGMMFCLFGVYLLDKAVTRAFRRGQRGVKKQVVLEN